MKDCREVGGGEGEVERREGDSERHISTRVESDFHFELVAKRLTTIATLCLLLFFTGAMRKG